MAAEYVVFAGTTRIDQLLSRLEAFAREVHGDNVDIRVVNVLDDPDLAEANAVFATPMVMRVLPLPPVRLIGVPPDVAAVASAFGHRLKPSHQRPEGGGVHS